MKSLKFFVLAAAALTLGACSTGNTFVKNVTAADCASPAAQQAFIAGLPQIAFITNAQAQELMAQFCIGAFGTVSAPVSAPGMKPAL